MLMCRVLDVVGSFEWVMRYEWLMKKVFDSSQYLL